MKNTTTINDQPGYYAIIPASVRYDDSLKLGAKLLYGEITALCNRKGYCWASNTYFAELYSVHKNTISLWIKQLLDSDYLRAVIVRGENNEIIERQLYVAGAPLPVMVATTTDDGSRTTTNSEDNIKSDLLNNKDKETTQNEDVLEVFNYWKETFKHPNAKLDKKRIARITNHLKNGFNVTDLKTAIYGVTKSPWHMGDNPTKTVYDKIDTIFRDSDQVEHFIDLSTKVVSNIQATRVTPSVTAPCALCSTTKKCKFHDEFSEYNRSKVKHVF